MSGSRSSRSAGRSSRTVKGMCERKPSTVVRTATYAPGFQYDGTCRRQESHQWWQETVRSAASGAGWTMPESIGLEWIFEAPSPP